MKNLWVMVRKIVTAILSTIGALTILVAILVIVDRSLYPGHLEVATKKFGTPEAMSAILGLYASIEKNPHDPKLQIVEVNNSRYSRIRNIPKSFLPDQFSSNWGEDLVGDNATGWDRVLAYYDGNDVLQGIEFYGSRYGCFISRDATRSPGWYSSLHRIASEPIYVTFRLCGD